MTDPSLDSETVDQRLVLPDQVRKLLDDPGFQARLAAWRDGADAGPALSDDDLKIALGLD